MSKPLLHFSHANGFPAPCYAAMLGALSRRCRVGWIEAIGTDPRYPVTEGWALLVEQLVDSLERDYGGEPVFGVGHSLGAYLTFLAAARRPDLFRAIPHDMYRHLQELKVPAGFVGGNQSDVVRRVSMSHMRGPIFVKRRVPGGHLFPFEHPHDAAIAIAELLEELG